MTSTVVPSFSSSARRMHVVSRPRTSSPSGEGLAGLGTALQQAWTAYQLRAQARSLMRRAEQFEATQPSYAADLRAAAMAVRSARVQAG